MNLLPLIDRALDVHLNQNVDSRIASTREFWRKKFFSATDAEAEDPRPFAEVLADREKGGAA